MESEILLQRSSTDVPWGFRIIGGSDSHLPIIISKVLENSIAEEAGLKEDFLVERINGFPTSGLTHAEVNEIIVTSDKELLFTVRSENLENLILASLNDANNNAEVSEILREAISNMQITEQSQCIKETTELDLKKEFGQIMILDSANQIYEQQDDELKQISSKKYQTAEKKWSTFLQKPKNPLPKPKGQPPPIPKSERYKVIIKKQPKKESSVMQFTGTLAQKDDPEPEDQPKEEIKDATPKAQDNETEEEPPGETCPNEELKDDTIVEIEPEVLEEGLEEPPQCDLAEGSNTEAETEMEQKIEGYEATEGEDNLLIETKCEPTLEEQLAAVQKQLSELAQLPSAIQETLSEVTQQLASIVGEYQPKLNPEEEEDAEQKNEEELETKKEDKVEEGNLEEDVDYRAELFETNSETAEMEGAASDILSDICEEEEMLEVIKEDPEAALEESEDQGQQEKDTKQQMIGEEENELKGPIVRPIILPGGRKWVDPDDAQPKVKNPKMTDEKICTTIETFSEVICGKTKGINFLKYTPPPKNLDHLQRSEVYRLIHGMEPPVRGIGIRSEKILAEEDYYGE